MYSHILIPLENSCTDNVILVHIRPLARLTKAKLTFVHVADGFMARNQKDLGESEEMRDDYQYLKRRELEFQDEGFDVKAVLLFGEPYKEILALAEKRTMRSYCNGYPWTSLPERYYSWLCCFRPPAQHKDTGIANKGLITGFYEN